MCVKWGAENACRAGNAYVAHPIHTLYRIPFIMIYRICVIGIIALCAVTCRAQTLSVFPEDIPRPWGGIGIAVPDAGISIQAYPRSIPFIIRPQIDFGIFQRHGHAVTGGKATLAWVTPFSTLGIGRTYLGGIVGHNVDRITNRREIAERRILEEDRIFSWGGVIGEMIEIVDAVYLTAEVRFLNQEVTNRAIDPGDAFGERTFERFRTTWMIGLQVYFL
jgi:hypothetical protein